MRKKTSNSQSIQKNVKKNAQSTAKKDILRKTSRQAVQNPASNAKKRQATLKAYKKTSKKYKKCVINGKERHITQNKPSRHAKLNKQYEKHQFKAEKHKSPTNNIQRQKKI
ncbi:hypothetical protein [Treponema berlinense]|uniref:hypothetical protein n=1 Tax=Treponema berlinense TaxID=225004 RepID=UPI002357ED53|nr:hypothetical protein [Treponema berlinense]